MEHLPARELVPGDIVDLNVGDKVPADIRLLTLKTATMRAIQSSLTGESEPVNKSQEAVEDADCEIQAKTCMLFAGTAIANGHCHGERRSDVPNLLAAYRAFTPQDSLPCCPD